MTLIRENFPNLKIGDEFSLYNRVFMVYEIEGNLIYLTCILICAEKTTSEKYRMCDTQ